MVQPLRCPRYRVSPHRVSLTRSPAKRAASRGHELKADGLEFAVNERYHHEPSCINLRTLFPAGSHALNRRVDLLTYPLPLTLHAELGGPTPCQVGTRHRLSRHKLPPNCVQGRLATNSTPGRFLMASSGNGCLIWSSSWKPARMGRGPAGPLTGSPPAWYAPLMRSPFETEPEWLGACANVKSAWRGSHPRSKLGFQIGFVAPREWRRRSPFPHGVRLLAAAASGCDGSILWPRW